jgi:hypothetical protein
VLHTSELPLEREEVIPREGFRVTAPVRSILDAASMGTAPEQVEMAIQQALAEGLLTPAPLILQAERRSFRVARLVRRGVQAAR